VIASLRSERIAAAAARYSPGLAALVRSCIREFIPKMASAPGTPVPAQAAIQIGPDWPDASWLVGHIKTRLE